MADTDKKPTEPPKPAESSNPFAANCLWGGVYAFAAFFLGQPQYPGGYIGVAAFFFLMESGPDEERAENQDRKGVGVRERSASRGFKRKDF